MLIRDWSSDVCSSDLLGFAMGLSERQTNQLSKIMLGLYKLFNDADLSLVELNPLAIMDSGELMALDGKINSDDNAAFRQPRLVAMRDVAQEDETEETGRASCGERGGR